MIRLNKSVAFVVLCIFLLQTMIFCPVAFGEKNESDDAPKMEWVDGKLFYFDKQGGRTIQRNGVRLTMSGIILAQKDML